MILSPARARLRDRRHLHVHHLPLTVRAQESVRIEEVLREGLAIACAAHARFAADDRGVGPEHYHGLVSDRERLEHHAGRAEVGDELLLAGAHSSHADEDQVVREHAHERRLIPTCWAWSNASAAVRTSAWA